MPGVGILFRFFLPRGRSLALAWILTEKLVARGSARGGGMVTGQIDTCISGMVRRQKQRK